MDIDLISRLATSEHVALVISLCGNVGLVMVVKKLYSEKEQLHKQMAGLLKDLLPFAIRLRGRNDQEN